MDFSEMLFQALKPATKEELDYINNHDCKSGCACGHGNDDEAEPCEASDD